MNDTHLVSISASEDEVDAPKHPNRNVYTPYYIAPYDTRSHQSSRLNTPPQLKPPSIIVCLTLQAASNAKCFSRLLVEMMEPSRE